MASTISFNQRRIARSAGFNDVEKRQLMEHLETTSPNIIFTTANTSTVIGNVKQNVSELQFPNDNFNGGFPVLGNAKYILEGVLFTNTSVTNGIAIDFNNSTAVVNNARISADFFFAFGAVENAQTTALNGNMASVGDLSAITKINIYGMFNCISSGNIGLRFCESGSSTGATIFQNSYLSLLRVS